MSLDSEIPGSSTFDKPVDDIREDDKSEPGSIYRKDSPQNLAKPQDGEGRDERDHSRFSPSYGAPGGRPKDDSSITKYPYRDDKPNTHNASSEFVVGLWLLRTAHELRVPAETRLVVATRPDDILEGLNPKFQARGKKCTATLKRADPANLRWIFSVECGNGPKVVRMKAFRAKNVTRLGKMDIDLSCSCPAWQWLGPEHHSKREEYLDGKPRGTASVPVIRDPTGINRVCKHVAAVLSMTRGWEVPKGR